MTKSFIKDGLKTYNEFLEDSIMNPNPLVAEPTAPTVLDQFLDDMEASPDDFGLRAIFADWCEDNDKSDVAECLRWTVENQKHPFCDDIADDWSWFDASLTKLKPDYADLPSSIYSQMEGRQVNRILKSFSSFRAAEQALWAAWAKAREAGEV